MRVKDIHDGKIKLRGLCMVQECTVIHYEGCGTGLIGRVPVSLFVLNWHGNKHISLVGSIGKK